MMRATETDGEFRVHVACRRSSRLSPSIASTGDSSSVQALDPEQACSPAVGFVSEGASSSMEAEDCSDLGDCLLDSSPLLILSPIPEELGLSEVSSSPITGSSTLSPATAVLISHDAIVDGGQGQVSSIASSNLGAGFGCLEAEVGDDSREACGAVIELFDDDGDRGGVDLCVGGALADGVAQTASEDAKGVALDVMSGEAQAIAFVPSSDDIQNTAKGDDGAVAYAGSLGEFSVVAECVPPAQSVHPTDAVIPDSSPHDVIFSHSLAPLLVADLCRNDGGGMVREEGRAPPVAKEAVRPQPTDGLRQLPRSSGESLPVSEVVAAAGGGFFGGVQTGAARGGI
ncbi:hypothetical protein Dimus_026753 [Dionaea muscipula]